MMHMVRSIMMVTIVGGRRCELYGLENGQTVVCLLLMVVDLGESIRCWWLLLRRHRADGLQWTRWLQVVSKMFVLLRQRSLLLFLLSSHLFLSYLSIMKSRWSCLMIRLESHRPSQVLAHSSFPFALMKSSSSVVNFAIDIDLTRCGGVKPRL